MLKEKEIICLSDKCINYINKYLLQEMNITSPINEEMLSNIEDECNEYNDLLAGKELGSTIQIDKQRCLLAGEVAEEIYSAIEFNKIDYNDLNKRLNLK